MNAKDKFQVGQNVCMTEDAIRQGLDGPKHRKTGVVKGFSHDGKFVRVHRDGDSLDSVRAFSVSFWQVITEATDGQS